MDNQEVPPAVAERDADRRRRSIDPARLALLGGETMKFYADLYEVAITTIENWINAGYKVCDPEALGESLAKQKNAPAHVLEKLGIRGKGSTVSAVDLEAAKYRLVTLQGDKIETQIAALKSRLLPVEQVQSDFTAIGLAVREKLVTLAIALPGRIAGQPEPVITALLREEFDAVLADLSNHESKLYTTRDTRGLGVADNE